MKTSSDLRFITEILIWKSYLPGCCEELHDYVSILKNYTDLNLIKSHSIWAYLLVAIAVVYNILIDDLLVTVSVKIIDSR